MVDLGFRLALPQTAIPFRGSIPEFPDEQSTGANPRCYDVVCGLFARLCRRPHNFGCIFVHSLVAPQTVNRPSGLLAATSVFVGGSLDWIISAGVISRAFTTGAVVVQNADPKRTTARDRQAKRATGIEPAWPAWKAGTLPLSYARAKNRVPRHPIPAKLFLARRRFDRLLFGEAAASYLGL